VDLWLSDFSQDPYEIAEAFPIRPFLVSRKGEPTGRRQRSASRNLVIFRYVFTYDTPWQAAIEALIISLGGWEEVGQLFSRLDCANRLLQFTLPIRNSPHQENDWIDPTTLGRLATFEIDLGMQFGEYQSCETR
jgi:hypothetical protein